MCSDLVWNVKGVDQWQSLLYRLDDRDMYILAQVNDPVWNSSQSTVHFHDMYTRSGTST